MKISDYDYQLPQDRIAIRPPEVRGQAKLLVLDKASGNIEHRQYANIVDYLDPGDVLVINTTKVIKARLTASNGAGRQIELLVLEKHGQQPVHTALHRGKVAVGEVLRVHGHDVRVVSESGGFVGLEADIDLYELAGEAGEVPLPPYMKRHPDKSDTERYQTVFANQEGSVAAPTASLNMTQELLADIRAKGVQVVPLTLHVGLGTFLPIRADDVEAHTMHREYFEIPAETARAVREATGRIVAVGTTVARTLEFAAPLLNSSSDAIRGEADIFIYPGYKFEIVDALLTNFHAPRSTVLMLAAAFAGGENLKNAYSVALEADYKFLSYGDSMLVK